MVIHASLLACRLFSGKYLVGLFLLTTRGLAIGFTLGSCGLGGAGSLFTLPILVAWRPQLDGRWAGGDGPPVSLLSSSCLPDVQAGGKGPPASYHD